MALNPLLAFSLMFSNRPGFACSPSFLNRRRLYHNQLTMWYVLYKESTEFVPSAWMPNVMTNGQLVIYDTLWAQIYICQTIIICTNLPSMMAMWPVWPKVNSSAGWLMLASVESPCSKMWNWSEWWLWWVWWHRWLWWQRDGYISKADEFSIKKMKVVGLFAH